VFFVSLFIFYTFLYSLSFTISSLFPFFYFCSFLVYYLLFCYSSTFSLLFFSFFCAFLSRFGFSFNLFFCQDFPGGVSRRRRDLCFRAATL